VRRLSVVLAGVVLSLSVLAWLGSRFWPAELASSLRPQLLGLAVVVLVIGLVVRSPVAAILATVAIAANVVVIGPLYRGGDSRATGSERLVVAHINLQRRALDQAELEQALRERKPDLVFLLDPPKDWVARQRTFAGYGVFGDGSPKVGAVVLARGAPVRVGRPLVDGLPGATLVVETTLASSTVWILGVHAQSPVTPHRLAKRDRTLRVVGRLAARHTGARIVLGDLNSTPWSSALNQLEDAAGLENSMDGRGLQASWPALLGPFGVPIDQFLSSKELVVLGRETGPTFGSTHRSLWVRVGLAVAAGQ
jgi:endonuclease/exonuclease/phosphatase (EEP) superfamily protein YafD